MLIKRILPLFILLSVVILPVNASFLSETAGAGEPYWKFHSDTESTDYFDAESVFIIRQEFPYYAIQGALWSEEYENGQISIFKRTYIFYYNVNSHVMKAREIMCEVYDVSGVFLYTVKDNDTLITLRASYMTRFPLLTAVGDFCFYKCYGVDFSKALRVNLE